MKPFAERIVIQQGDLTEMDTDAIGSIPVGYAAITTGGKLKARFVIHAASMELGGKTSAGSLRNSTAHSLRIANDRGFKSISFPAVGTGIAGFPLKECAEIMLREAARNLRGETSIETVYFVLFDEAAEGIFKRVWKQIWRSPPRTPQEPRARDAARGIA